MALRKFPTVLMLLVLVSMINYTVDAQFFTKSSSKSIPRMGRRSGGFAAQQNPRALISNLLDFYGPRLVEALLVSATGLNI